MEWFWDAYVPDRSQRTDAYAAPLHAKDFSGLPPLFLSAAELDPLKDDTVQIVPNAITSGNQTVDYTYTSSNEAVATVDENGLVTAVGNGTAVITTTGTVAGSNSLSATTQKVLMMLMAQSPQTKVIDLSADFRLHDTAAYAKWYGHEHHAPALQKEARLIKITPAGFRESHVHDVTITKEAPNYRSE